jgi:hypothetical protein
MQKDKIQEAYEKMFEQKEDGKWTVVRIWRNVNAKKSTDAIQKTKSTKHDEVQSFKSGEGRKITIS